VARVSATGSGNNSCSSRRGPAGVQCPCAPTTRSPDRQSPRRPTRRPRPSAHLGCQVRGAGRAGCDHRQVPPAPARGPPVSGSAAGQLLGGRCRAVRQQCPAGRRDRFPWPRLPSCRGLRAASSAPGRRASGHPGAVARHASRATSFRRFRDTDPGFRARPASAGSTAGRVVRVGPAQGRRTAGVSGLSFSSRTPARPGSRGRLSHALASVAQRSSRLSRRASCPPGWWVPRPGVLVSVSTTRSAPTASSASQRRPLLTDGQVPYQLALFPQRRGPPDRSTGGGFRRPLLQQTGPCAGPVRPPRRHRLPSAVSRRLFDRRRHWRRRGRSWPNGRLPRSRRPDLAGQLDGLAVPGGRAGPSARQPLYGACGSGSGGSRSVSERVRPIGGPGGQRAQQAPLRFAEAPRRVSATSTPTSSADGLPSPAGIRPRSPPALPAGTASRPGPLGHAMANVRRRTDRPVGPVPRSRPVRASGRCRVPARPANIGIGQHQRVQHGQGGGASRSSAALATDARVAGPGGQHAGVRGAAGVERSGRGAQQRGQRVVVQRRAASPPMRCPTSGDHGYTARSR